MGLTPDQVTARRKTRDKQLRQRKSPPPPPQPKKSGSGLLGLDQTQLNKAARASSTKRASVAGGGGIAGVYQAGKAASRADRRQRRRAVVRDRRRRRQAEVRRLGLTPDQLLQRQDSNYQKKVQRTARRAKKGMRIENLYRGREKPKTRRERQIAEAGSVLSQVIASPDERGKLHGPGSTSPRLLNYLEKGVTTPKEAAQVAYERVPFLRARIDAVKREVPNLEGASKKAAESFAARKEGEYSHARRVVNELEKNKVGVTLKKLRKIARDSDPDVREGMKDDIQHLERVHRSLDRRSAKLEARRIRQAEKGAEFSKAAQQAQRVQRREYENIVSNWIDYQNAGNLFKAMKKGVDVFPSGSVRYTELTRAPGGQIISTGATRTEVLTPDEAGRDRLNDILAMFEGGSVSLDNRNLRFRVREPETGFPVLVGGVDDVSSQVEQFMREEVGQDSVLDVALAAAAVFPYVRAGKFVVDTARKVGGAVKGTKAYRVAGHTSQEIRNRATQLELASRLGIPKVTEAMVSAGSRSVKAASEAKARVVRARSVARDAAMSRAAILGRPLSVVGERVRGHLSAAYDPAAKVGSRLPAGQGGRAATGGTAKGRVIREGGDEVWEFDNVNRFLSAKGFNPRIAQRPDRNIAEHGMRALGTDAAMMRDAYLKVAAETARKQQHDSVSRALLKRGALVGSGVSGVAVVAHPSDLDEVFSGIISAAPSLKEVVKPENWAKAAEELALSTKHLDNIVEGMVRMAWAFASDGEVRKNSIHGLGQIGLGVAVFPFYAAHEVVHEGFVDAVAMMGEAISDDMKHRWAPIINGDWEGLNEVLREPGMGGATFYLADIWPASAAASAVAFRGVTGTAKFAGAGKIADYLHKERPYLRVAGDTLEGARLQRPSKRLVKRITQHLIDHSRKRAYETRMGQRPSLILGRQRKEQKDFLVPGLDEVVPLFQASRAIYSSVHGSRLEKAEVHRSAQAQRETVVRARKALRNLRGAFRGNKHVYDGLIYAAKMDIRSERAMHRFLTAQIRQIESQRRLSSIKSNRDAARPETIQRWTDSYGDGNVQFVNLKRLSDDLVLPDAKINAQKNAKHQEFLDNVSDFSNLDAGEPLSRPLNVKMDYVTGKLFIDDLQEAAYLSIMRQVEVGPKLPVVVEAVRRPNLPNTLPRAPERLRSKKAPKETFVSPSRAGLPGKKPVGWTGERTINFELVKREGGIKASREIFDSKGELLPKHDELAKMRRLEKTFRDAKEGSIFTKRVNDQLQEYALAMEAAERYGMIPKQVMDTAHWQAITEFLIRERMFEHVDPAQFNFAKDLNPFVRRNMDMIRERAREFGFGENPVHFPEFRQLNPQAQGIKGWNGSAEAMEKLLGKIWKNEGFLRRHGLRDTDPLKALDLISAHYGVHREISRFVHLMNHSAVGIRNLRGFKEKKTYTPEDLITLAEQNGLSIQQGMFKGGRFVNLRALQDKLGDRSSIWKDIPFEGTADQAKKAFSAKIEGAGRHVNIEDPAIAAKTFEELSNIKNLSELVKNGDIAYIPDRLWNGIMRDYVPDGRMHRFALQLPKTWASKIILGGANVSWLGFQVIANSTLAGIAGVGPRSLIPTPNVAFLRHTNPALKFYNDLPDTWKKSFDELLSVPPHAADIGTNGMRRQHLNLDKLFARTDFGQNMWVYHLKGRNPLDILFHGDTYNNRFHRKVVLSTKVKREAYRRMGGSLARFRHKMEKALGITESTTMKKYNKAVDDIFKDPRITNELVREMDKFLGDYTSFTYWERQYLQKNLMFYGFFRHSVQFMLWNLPKNHPGRLFILSHLTSLAHDGTVDLLNEVLDQPINAIQNPELGRFFLKGPVELPVVGQILGEGIHEINLRRASIGGNPLFEARHWGQMITNLNPFLISGAEAFIGQSFFGNRMLRTQAEENLFNPERLTLWADPMDRIRYFAENIASIFRPYQWYAESQASVPKHLRSDADTFLPLLRKESKLEVPSDPNSARAKKIERSQQEFQQLGQRHREGRFALGSQFLGRMLHDWGLVTPSPAIERLNRIKRFQLERRRRDRQPSKSPRMVRPEDFSKALQKKRQRQRSRFERQYGDNPLIHKSRGLID